MKKHSILKWEDAWNEVKDDSSLKLLLGNGASIAISDQFRYQSLYEEADQAGRLTKNLIKVFEFYETTDFEYILRILWETNRVNTLLNIQDLKTLGLYRSLKNILLETMTEIHPTHEKVENSLRRISDFMKPFHTVLSLNYDLLVYWAMLEGNDQYPHGYWFKDCFLDGVFDENCERFRRPYGAEGATLVFYPHGNLILAIDDGGEEIKLESSKDLFLLEAITDRQEYGDCIPLFVSEGSTDEKMRAIRRSYYLSTVYYEHVEDGCDSLVIFGWSMKNDDEHILRALVNGGFQKIVISVHSKGQNAESYCDWVEFKIKEMHRKLHKEKVKYKILFFDAESEGCWNN